MKKIWMTSALSLAMLVSAAGPALAAAPAFTDLANHPAKSQIEALASKGIINGLSDQVFGPNAELSAAQGVTLIARGMQLKGDAAAADSSFFAAMDQKAWYTPFFALVHAAGVTLPADIDPAKPLTKEQFTVYLVQALEKTGKFPMINIVPAAIADEDQLDIVNQGAVRRALHYQLVSLDATGKFNPQAKLTRADAAAITFKAVELLEKQQAKGDEAKGEAASSDRWMNLPEGATPAPNE